MRRLFAVPSWTERAALVAIGVWLLAYSLASVLISVNVAGSFLLPNEPTGPNSWRPAQPLENVPYRLQAGLMIAGPLLLFAFIALGIASWGNDAKWRRFLVMFALADALIVLLAYQALAAGHARTNVEAIALHQAMTAPFIGISVALAWPSRAGRRLALGGAALLALAYATTYPLNEGFGPDSFWANEARFAALVIGVSSARAIVPALWGAGVLLAARESSPRASPSVVARAPS